MCLGIMQSIARAGGSSSSGDLLLLITSVVSSCMAIPLQAMCSGLPPLLLAFSVVSGI